MVRPERAIDSFPLAWGECSNLSDFRAPLGGKKHFSSGIVPAADGYLRCRSCREIAGPHPLARNDSEDLPGAARFPKRRKILNSSLSVLLPVHNAQALLSNRVQRVLDVLPELTHRFEVVIVDDGSTDATCEVAYELARDFPQVNVFRNAVQQGWAKAVTTPALRAAGDFVMIHCGGTLETDDIVGLWRVRDGIAAAAIAKATAAQTGKSLRIDGGSIAPAQDKPTSSDLAAGSLGIHARAQRSNLLMVHRHQLGQLERTLSALAAAATPSQRQHSQRKPLHTAPNILRRLKSLALGE
jgi:hypothetical protein